MTRLRARTLDPVEKIIADALDRAGIRWVDEYDPQALGLDFYLPELGTHIEVKQYHTPRTAAQMERTGNIIVIVGIGAARAFASMIGRPDGD